MKEDNVLVLEVSVTNVGPLETRKDVNGHLVSISVDTRRLAETDLFVTPYSLERLQAGAWYVPEDHCFVDLELRPIPIVAFIERHHLQRCVIFENKHGMYARSLKTGQEFQVALREPDSEVPRFVFLDTICGELYDVKHNLSSIRIYTSSGQGGSAGSIPAKGW